MVDTLGHLLFVEDETAFRTVSVERLRENGFEVAEAETGEKALELLEQFAFDVVISDLLLPGIDGVQVIESAAVIRASSASSSPENGRTSEALLLP